MLRPEHNMRGVQFGIELSVANTVNKDKDGPSQKYPGCKHHGYNHGIGTNLKYSRIGRGGMVMSVIHNIDDRITRKCQNPIIIERMKTWYPTKFINEMSNIGEWWE